MNSRDELTSRLAFASRAATQRTLALRLVVAGLLGVAIWVRLASATAALPSGDGGLFWVMAGELRDHGFIPPRFTAYNMGGIPWVYPPVGLYLAALLGGGLDWFRILPAAFAIATLPAFWLLARALIGARGAVVALVAYGLSVPAYLGLVAGGGVTRGPGMLFAILTMWAVARGYPVRAGVFGGLTLLSHPIAAFYLVLASATLWLTRGAQRKMLLAPVIALSLGATWFVPIALNHGIEPLVSGLGSRQLDIPKSVVTVAASAVNPPNLAYTVGIVGTVVAASRRRWDLLAWLATTLLGVAVVDRWVVLPAAVLAGLAVDAALETPRRLRSVAVVAIAVASTIVGLALSDRPAILPTHERSVMAWAATTTPSDATFAVIGYSADHGVVEWFPALSGRRNVTAWQGTEWVPDGFRRNLATEYANCRAVSCLPEADYYVLRPGCCPAIAAVLEPVGPDVYVMP